MRASPYRFAAFVLCGLITSPSVSAQSLKVVRERSLGGFGDPITLSVDRRGFVYIRDASKPGIIVVDSTGQQARHLGRPGRGPGETDRTTTWGWVGDTLWVSDEGLGRVNFYPGGQLPSHSLTFAEVAGRNDSVPRFPIMFSSNGTVIWETADGTHPIKPVYSVRYFRTDRKGRKLEQIASFDWMPTFGRHGRPGFTMVVTDRGTEAVRSSPHPIPPFSLLVAAETGGYLTRLDRQPADDGKNGVYVLTRWSDAGQVTWTKKIEYVPQPVTESILDSLANEYSKDPQRRARFLKALNARKFLPPVREMVVGQDGSIYLQREGGSSTAKWDVIGPDGAVVGSIVLPNNTIVLAATLERIWVREGEEGEYKIARYSIAR
jgi:hypothetical protein